MTASVVILTFNEERDLPACLCSLNGCSDVHVIDSGSSDATVQVAKDHGANVYINEFRSFAQQRNWALDNVKFKHPWILFLDADECATPDFLAALSVVTSSTPRETAGYYCCWKLMLNNRWLRFSDRFPRWQFRLLRAGRARFTDYGHGQKEGEVQGQLQYLRQPYLHYAFSKGWDAWTARHRLYAAQEAASRLGTAVNWRDLFSLHSSRRAIVLKPLLSRLPFWPKIFFIGAYFFRLGFLDGRAGYQYTSAMAWYEHLIQLKMRELRRRA